MGNHQANSTAKFYKLPSFPPKNRVAGLIQSIQEVNGPPWLLEPGPKNGAPTVGVAAARDLPCLTTKKGTPASLLYRDHERDRALHGVRRFGD